MSSQQPRERAVPCQGCGYTFRNGRPRVKVTTFNVSGFCDDCESRGIPESRAAKREIDKKNAQRRVERSKVHTHHAGE